MRTKKYFMRTLSLIVLASMLMMSSIAIAAEPEFDGVVTESDTADVTKEPEEQETKISLMPDGYNCELVDVDEECPNYTFLSGVSVEVYEDEASVSNIAELQQAIDSALGETIIVISQSFEFGTTPISVPAGAEITIRSTDGSVFILTQSNSVIRHFLVDGNLTLENIVLDGSTQDVATGGGVQVNSGGSFIMDTGSLIRNCSAVYGGGVYVKGGNFNMAGGEISGNTSINSGGGIFAEEKGDLTIFGYSKIADNEASQYGGGIFTTAGVNFNVSENVVISGNAASYGGGIAAVSGGNIIIDGNVTIIGNKATVIGGGACVLGTVFTISSGGTTTSIEYDSTITMNGGEIRGNTSDDMGGGVYVSSVVTADAEGIGTFIMNGGSIGNNTSVNGGGVYVGSSSSEFIVTDGSITDNTAAEDGGGIYTTDYSNLSTSVNTIFNGNMASALYEPPADAATAYPNIKFAGISVPGILIIDHPLNNYDINYNLSGNIYYRISYDANGGEGAIASKFVKSGDSVTLSDGTGFTWYGYNLTGWNTASDGSGDFYILGGSLVVNENLTLYAQWKSIELETGKHLKYLNGYPDGSVRADADMSRAEAASIFYRLLKETYRDGNAVSAFVDVNYDAWYSLAVSTLADMGIISGYEDGTFRPNNPITRAEFTAMATGFDELTSEEGNAFSDVDSGHWAVAYINTAYSNKWINGYEDGTFKPEQSITRAEVVKIVNTMLNRNPATIEAPNPYNDITSSHWAYIHILEASIEHNYIRDDNGTEIWVT